MGNTGTQDQAAAIPTRQAITPGAGVALVNGTPNILQWTAPNDGLPHAFAVAASLRVTGLETGGAVGVTYTVGGNQGTQPLFAGGKAVAIYNAPDAYPENGFFQCDPGTTVTIVQSSALTAGAAVFVGELLGI